MNKKDTFLIEIGTEELPPRMLKVLSETLAIRLQQQLAKENFHFGQLKTFATPRRIAVLIDEVDAIQPDKIIERKGPALTVAIDANNCPTPAGLGFARSCGVDFDALEIQKAEGSGWLVHRYQQKGRHFTELAPSIVIEALKLLPMGKTMRWNQLDIEFLRPVHWVALMYGSQVISTEILGLLSDSNTFGHRFHHPEPIALPHANQYEPLLETVGKVIPNFAKRRAMILQQIQDVCKAQNAQPVFNETLLDEVTGLVEWPVPVVATFAEEFLALPKEVLISAIEQHQKCFPVENKQSELKPCFVTISNIQSINPEQIIIGNERVMRARLSDAAFFFYMDKKHSLESRLETLKQVTFQAKLGSLFDKSMRLSRLSCVIADHWLSKQAFNMQAIERAGLLAKTDLVTDMVYEFPELQGVMGYYYALHDGENQEICTAISEHYLPKFSGDKIPSTLMGCALAIADRMDNLVGIFSLGQIPTGDKDPFGLRRAAMGILRILIEQELRLPLDHLIKKTIEGYAGLIKKTDFTSELRDFMIERLRAWYNEKGISTDTFNAVIAIQNNEPLDIHHRILAVERFRSLPESQALTMANKRVTNILEQAEFNLVHHLAEPNPDLFETDAEKNLYSQLKQLKQADSQEKSDYTFRLTEFAKLQVSVDHFFDVVMVMTPEADKRNNRLQLLAQLRALFLQIADVSLLYSSKVDI